MIYVAFGGGVNSTAMLIGMFERKLMWPSWVVFADTGGEKPETYAHVDEMDAWLQAQGHAGIVRLKKDSMYASLEDECLRKNTMPSLVFGWRSCSDKWKQAPQQKFMNRDKYAQALWESGKKITRAIGFGVDEMRRAKEFEDEKYRNWYPLIEWGWDRQACIEAIERVGITVPVKSSCFFCPATRKVEVALLSIEHPDLFKRALKMEENATAAHTAKGLGRHWTWKEIGGGPETIEQTCMCFDGE